MPHELTSILRLPPTLSSQFEVRGSWGSTTITSKENLRTLHVGAFERYGGVTGVDIGCNRHFAQGNPCHLPLLTLPHPGPLCPPPPPHTQLLFSPNVTELRKLLIAAKAKAAGFGVPDAVPAGWELPAEYSPLLASVV
jgi:hypothetical protein